MPKILFFVLLCAVARAASPDAPEFLTVRAVAWDQSWRPATEQAWIARVAGAVAAAAKAGVDIIVFPEGFSNGRPLDDALSAVKDAAGGRLVVLGNAPHRQPGSDQVFSRAYILSGGAWQVMDKLDPTPAERAQKPPVLPGMRIPLFRFRGGVVAALPAYSIEKPEISASLKRRALQLVLVSAPATDAAGAARVARSAAARAVELGAAVVVAASSPQAPSLHLPAQTGFELNPKAPSGRDFRLPWKKLLELRSPADLSSTEERPFLDPTPHFQVEI